MARHLRHCFNASRLILLQRSRRARRRRLSGLETDRSEQNGIHTLVPKAVSWRTRLSIFLSFKYAWAMINFTPGPSGIGLQLRTLTVTLAGSIDWIWAMNE
jgi:hypothetical protein